LNLSLDLAIHRARRLVEEQERRICRDSAPYGSDGRAVWACTSTDTTDPILVKIGWSRPSTKTGTTVDQAAQPSIVLPVTPGSTL